MIDATGNINSIAVLGGTSDIAMATLRELAGPRLRRVVLAGRKSSALADAAAAVRELGVAEIEVVNFDAADLDSHGAAIGQIFTGCDTDVVLLAFGVLGDQMSDEQDPASALRVAQVNYLGAMSAAMYSAEHLKRQGRGVLVVLSSVAGERARRSNYIYGSSKAGLDVFATGLGESLRGTGVRVIVVRPGFVKTKMTQGRRVVPGAVDAEVVAAAIVKAIAAPGKELVYVPATMRVVMSVLRHVPRPIFRRLPI